VIHPLDYSSRCRGSTICIHDKVFVCGAYWL